MYDKILWNTFSRWSVDSGCGQ